MAENETQEKARLTTLSVSVEFANRLRIVANQRDLTLPEALDKFAGPGIEREYRKVVREMNAELGGEG